MSIYENLTHDAISNRAIPHADIQVGDLPENLRTSEDTFSFYSLGLLIQRAWCQDAGQ